MTLDDIKFWKERVRWGLRWQARLNRPQRWSQARRWYKNEYGDGVVSVNLIFAIGRKLVTDVYFKNPQILVKSEHPEADTNAPIMESVTRDLLPLMNVKEQAKLVILDAYLTNFGVYKIGYHCPSTLTNKSKGLSKSSANVLAQLSEFLQTRFGGSQDASTENPEIPEDEDYPFYSHHNDIKPNAPWGLRWPPSDVILPWGCRNWREAEWVAFKSTRPKYEMEADPAYESRVVKNAKGHFHEKGDEWGDVMSPKDKEPEAPWPEEQLTTWEIWDRQSRKCRVLAMKTDEWFRNEKVELGCEGLPFQVLQFNPTGDDCYGTSDVEQIHKQVLEYNETRTIEMLHKKVSLTRIAVDSQKIDDTELTKLVSGQIMPVIKCNGNPDGVIKYFVPPTANELFVIDERIRRDIGELMNFSRNQGGAAESPRKSASEAMIIHQAILQRADERRDQVGDFLEQIFGQKIHPIIWTNWSTQRYTMVAGNPNWVPYTGLDLKGFYGVSVVADSSAPLSKDERKQDAAQMFQAFKGDPHIIQYNLYKNVIEKMEGMPVNQVLLPIDKFNMVDRAILMMQQGMHERQMSAEDGAGQQQQSSGGQDSQDSGGGGGGQ